MHIYSLLFLLYISASLFWDILSLSLPLNSCVCLSLSLCRPPLPAASAGFATTGQVLMWNFLIYIISPLHNLAEAQTATDRHTVMAVPLCCFAASVCCLQQQVHGVWTAVNAKMILHGQAGSLEQMATFLSITQFASFHIRLLIMQHSTPTTNNIDLDWHIYSFASIFVLTCVCMYDESL